MRYGRLVLVLIGSWPGVLSAQLGTPEPAPVVSDLPLVQYPGQGPASDCLVILLSGDGGWRPLVQGISERLSAAGMPVLGINAFQYLRHRKSPEQVTADVSRLIRYGQATFGTSRVWLVGYSCGANLLPFAYNRLEPDLRAQVQKMVLLSPESKADFRFHWYNRVNLNSPQAHCIRPELVQMHELPTLFVYGSKENNQWCADLISSAFHALTLPGGHHYNYDIERLAAAILTGS